MITDGVLRQRWGVLQDRWRTRLWPLPSLAVVAAVGLGVGLPRLDARMSDAFLDKVVPYLFGGGPEAARSVLSAVAASLITVTSLTFSLTVVTLQLASSQYSPRILRTFVRDRFVHLALALLLGTFTYSLMVLRTVHTPTGDEDAFVPHVSVTVAYLLAIASVVVLVFFLAHLARQIRAELILLEVHSDTTETLRRVLDRYPVGEARTAPAVPATGVTTVCAQSSGFLTSVDERTLLSAAVHAGAVVQVDRFPGDSIVAGTPVAAVWPVVEGTDLAGEALADLTAKVGKAVCTGFERTAAEDIAFGLRQLVDVAIRALSPAVNDPTTAVHALNHASALLCEVVGHDLGPRLLRDDEGRVRVVLSGPDAASLLDLVMTQTRHYGAADPDMLVRLFGLLREVAWRTRRAEDHEAVVEQLTRLRASGSRHGHDEDMLDLLESQVHDAIAGRWSTTR